MFHNFSQTPCGVSCDTCRGVRPKQVLRPIQLWGLPFKKRNSVKDSLYWGPFPPPLNCLCRRYEMDATPQFEFLSDKIPFDKRLSCLTTHQVSSTEHWNQFCVFIMSAYTVYSETVLSESTFSKFNIFEDLNFSSSGATASSELVQICFKCFEKCFENLPSHCHHRRKGYHSFVSLPPDVGRDDDDRRR